MFRVVQLPSQKGVFMAELLGYDEKVYTNICCSRGHTICVYVTNTAVDPESSLVAEERACFCNVCGMSLDEIRTRKEKKARARKPKETVEAPAQ
jgi:hypothetical protein